MRKYWTILKTEIASMAAFRATALVWLLFDLCLILAFPFVLIAIYNQNGALGGFTKPGIISYYFLIAVFSNLVWLHPEGEMSREIREGTMTRYIVRPFNYAISMFIHEIGWKVGRSLLFLPFIIVFLIFGKSYLIVPSLTALPFLVLMLAGSATILYLVAFIVSLSAFWLEENSSVLSLFWITGGMLSGFYVPIMIFPTWLIKLISFTPWYFAVSEPIHAIINDYPVTQLIYIILMQITWILILYGIYKVIWHWGLKRYSAVGQ